MEELVSKYVNLVTTRYEYGYRVLTLAWADDVTTIPVRYSLLASSYDEKVRDTIRDDVDSRSIGARIRKLARTSMNGLTVRFACEAVKAGIPASTIAFDSWLYIGRADTGNISKFWWLTLIKLEVCLYLGMGSMSVKILFR